MKKLMNKKAFTIMEMLIVVAIIAVLVAIAIPTFSSALTKAKEATDVANVRAAYAAVQVEALMNSSEISITGGDQATLRTNFIKYAGDNVKLNDAENLTFAYDSSSKKLTVTYTPDQLTGGNGTKGSSGQEPYVWTVENVTTTLS